VHSFNASHGPTKKLILSRSRAAYSRRGSKASPFPSALHLHSRSPFDAAGDQGLDRIGSQGGILYWTSPRISAVCARLCDRQQVGRLGTRTSIASTLPHTSVQRQHLYHRRRHPLSLPAIRMEPLRNARFVTVSWPTAQKMFALRAPSAETAQLHGYPQAGRLGS